MNDLNSAQHMKDRIAQIMKSENMTQQDFAASLDISPSTLSSIFNERTQPSLAIVNKIHERFPAVNLLWLLYGTGEMYDGQTAEGGNDSPIPLKTPAPQDKGGTTPGGTDGGDLFLSTPQTPPSPVTERVIEKVKYIDKPVRRITEINVYFDDGTYEVFVPRKKE